MKNTFDHILLLGRPAAGKSEFIDFMKKTPDGERAEKYHIAPFEELDDFVWLWEKFLEDDEWEAAGHPRVFSNRISDGNYAVKPEMTKLYDLMFPKFNVAVKKKYEAQPGYLTDHTLFIEFARGREGAYHRALSKLSREVLERAAILYVSVDFEESWRRNVARWNEKHKGSSLEHMAPREIMERIYKTDDWQTLTGNEPAGYLPYLGLRVPFATMNNTPELKARDALDARYTPVIEKLWNLYVER